MKNFKKITLGLLGATILSLGLCACSNDEQATTSNTSTEQNVMAAKTNKYSFLKEYYREKDYIIGKNVFVDNFKITEVLFNDVNLVGYIVEEKETEDFLFFADKNLNTDEIYFKDMKTGEEVKWTEISKD